MTTCCGAENTEGISLELSAELPMSGRGRCFALGSMGRGGGGGGIGLEAL